MPGTIGLLEGSDQASKTCTWTYREKKVRFPELSVLCSCSIMNAAGTGVRPCRLKNQDLRPPFFCRPERNIAVAGSTTNEKARGLLLLAFLCQFLSAGQ